MKPDEEIKKAFKLFIDENGIINLLVLDIEKKSEDNVRLTELVEEGLLEIFNKNPEKRYNWFIDITPSEEKAHAFSNKSRKIGKRIASHKQLKNIGVVVSSIFMRTIIGFVASVTGRGKNIKCFSDKEKALEWLKED